MSHQVGFEGRHVERGAGAVNHRAEQAPDLRAGARPHQGVDRLGGTTPVLCCAVKSSEIEQFQKK